MVVIRAAGATTALQAVRYGRIGSGYVPVKSSSAAFIWPCIEANQRSGPGLLVTLVVISALLQFMLSARIVWFRRILTPTISGTVLMLVPVCTMSTVFGLLTDVPDGKPGYAAQGAVRRRPGNAPVLLLRGTRGEGARHRRALPGSVMTHPGVYCLRSSETDWDEATLWRTYFTLTDLEAEFRSLKSELGLRPIYHPKPIRADGHLFITVIAYQLVQVIRTRLRQAGENASWSTLHRILEGQWGITATFRRADGRTLHMRKATCAEPPQQANYDALGIGSTPGGPARQSCKRSSNMDL